MDAPKDTVTLGSIVRVLDIEEDFEETYEIVGSQEANPRIGRISDDSPVGKALVGSKKGATVKVDTPKGAVELNIIDVYKA